MTEKVVSIDELKAKIGPKMVAKMSPSLRTAVMSGGCTLQVDGTVYRASSDEDLTLAYKAAERSRGVGRRSRAEESDDEAKPEPSFMPPVPVAERESMFTAAMELIAGKKRERSGNSDKPVKIAMRLEGAAQVSVLVAPRGTKPQNAQEERVQNQRDDDARKPVFKTFRALARRLGGGDAA